LAPDWVEPIGWIEANVGAMETSGRSATIRVRWGHRDCLLRASSSCRTAQDPGAGIVALRSRARRLVTAPSCVPRYVTSAFGRCRTRRLNVDGTVLGLGRCALEVFDDVLHRPRCTSRRRTNTKKHRGWRVVRCSSFAAPRAACTGANHAYDLERTLGIPRGAVIERTDQPSRATWATLPAVLGSPCRGSRRPV